MKRETVPRRRPTQDDAILGHKIKSRRTELGLSQSDIGQPLGLSFQQIQKYERGINRVSAGRLTAIANILDVPMSFFYGEQNAPRDSDSLIKLDAKSRRVVQAFSRIKSRRIRRQLVVLVERLAEDQD